MTVTAFLVTKTTQNLVEIANDQTNYIVGIIISNFGFFISHHHNEYLKLWQSYDRSQKKHIYFHFSNLNPVCEWIWFK